MDRIPRLPLNPHDRQMDWQGQKLSEQLMQVILVSFSMAAYLTSFMIESFRVMMLIYAGGVVLTALISVPNWPR